MRGVSGKRPRGAVAENTLPWAARVPKPAMDADSLVDYGSGFLRKSCDSCVSSKRRCDGQDPCSRCQRRKKPCHYTERKKCGPRSGQKASKGTRRTRVAQPPQPPSGQQAATAPRDNHSTIVPNSRLAGGNVEWNYAGMRLGPPLPVHAPIMSTDELGGETTGVDYTDVSDAPPQRLLSRDSSGSSWWSLEEQQTAAAAAATASTPGASAAAAVALNVNPSHVRYCNYPPQYRYLQHSSGVMGESESWAIGMGGRCVGGGGGGGGGGSSSSSSGREGVGGSSGGSHGSAGDTSEDDISEEGLGQTEEEVAALLIRLGQTRTYLDGFTSVNDPPAGNNQAQSMRSLGQRQKQQHGWSGGQLYGRNS